jgi:RHS repeat-associated protein
MKPPHLSRVFGLAMVVCATASHLAAIGIGPTAATPSTIVLNAPATVTITSQITDPTLLPAGVNLVRMDASGPTIVGVLHDDGLNGDAAAGDGIYSYQFTVTPSSVGAIGYQVTAAFRGVLLRSQTSVFYVNVVPGAPSITDFTPKTGPVGTLVTITGNNFAPYTGVVPQLSMAKLGGGTINAPLASLSNTSVSFVAPTGAATGNLAVSIGGGLSATTTQPYTLTASTSFSVSAAPGTASLIQGQSVTYAVSLASTNGFGQLAALSVAGVPNGVTATFKPTQITAGQTSILTLTAPASQPLAANQALSVTAAATIDGMAVSQNAAATLSVVAPTTSFLGRTVVTDSQETPLGGVTVTMLGKDGNGNTTGCTGSGLSDGAGNFNLTGLPSSCVGPQLIGFDGTTVTSPAGKYSGVSLVYTLASGQVTASPVLVHLPRVDNVETFLVQQNAAADQSYSYKSIPGLSVTVYANTTLTMPDGTTPNPFALGAIQVAVDRLPDLKAAVPTMIGVFFVSFQPTNGTASQPIAVTFPNTLNTPAGTDMPLLTLDPTRGKMVPYGTGTVSSDGSQVIPDPDPTHPGHRYGLVHFDWHGQMPPPPNSNNPGGGGGCTLLGCSGGGGTGGAGGAGAGGAGAGGGGGSGTGGGGGTGAGGNSGAGGSSCSGSGNSNASGGDPCNEAGPPIGGEPVDLASGLEYFSVTDIALSGTRGSISIQRVYRTLTSTDGPFGLGTGMQYGWQLDTGSPSSATAINLISPDGNQFLFSRQSDGTLTNSSIPSLQGAVMSINSSGQASLRYYNGTVYQFQTFAGVSYLASITDRNGNTINFTVVQGSRTTLRITQITDPVGRSLNLTLDSNGHITSVTDPIGRTVSYTYNASGTLATVTNPASGLTRYQYDSQNRMTSMIDPRGVTVFQNTYDANGRVSQQIGPDGSITQFVYTLVNPLVATSPVVATTVTDALGNQTSYRFNVQGFVTNVTDALGQSKTFLRDPGTNQPLQVSGPAQCTVCGPLGQGDHSYTYDAKGNKLTYTDALGNTTRYTYDPVFNQIKSVTDPLGHKSTYTYDSAGNLSSFVDQNGSTTKYTYGTNGVLVQVTDPLGNDTTIGYDGFANPTSVTDALGNVSKVVFDAVSRPVVTTDPLGRTTTIGYDALSRIVSVRDGRGNMTRFSYDPVGNLLSLTDARGNSTTFTYDSLNRVKSRTSALGKTETYQYDLNGNVILFTDRRGQTSSFQYDVLNRRVREIYQDGAVVTRSYDAYSRLQAVNDSVGGVFGFAYDLNGSTIAQSEPTGTVQYVRDQLRRIASRQVNGHNAVAYTYDSVGNVLRASMTGAGISYSYDARNLPLSASRTNGVSTSYAYDLLGRVLSITHSKGTTSLNTQAYGYDPIGNRISASNDISQPLITSAAGASVDNADELLTYGQTTYTYDANGNRLAETSPSGTVKYQWDSRNRLASIMDATGNVTSFQYDFLRNLLEIDRTSAGITTTQSFVVDSLTNVVALTETSGLPVAVLTGTSIDSHYASVDSSGQALFALGDPLGSTVAVTDASGTAVFTIDYEPYGQTTLVGSTDYPFLFTGRNAATKGVFYFRDRYYDALAGRFLSEDSVDQSKSDIDLYRYVRSNPVTATDPTGHDPASSVSQGACKAACYAQLRNHSKDPEPFQWLNQCLIDCDNPNGNKQCPQPSPNH